MVSAVIEYTATRSVVYCSELHLQGLSAVICLSEPRTHTCNTQPHSAAAFLHASLPGHRLLVCVLSVLLAPSCSHPFIYFPTFYTVKSLVEQQPHPLEHAYNKWRNEIWDSCKALWTLWVPCQIINFAFVPRHFRVPFGEPLVSSCKANCGPVIERGTQACMCVTTLGQHATHNIFISICTTACTILSIYALLCHRDLHSTNCCSTCNASSFPKVMTPTPHKSQISQSQS